MKSITNTIEEILLQCKGKRYIFRGEDRCYKGVTSSLYRQYGDGSPVSEAEQELVTQARRHIRPDATNIEVLTDLQHFGVNTALIDFTQNILVALFFACDAHYDQDGRVIMMNVDNLNIKTDINYKKDTEEINIFTPSGKSPRVIFQSSIFVRARKGFIPASMYKEVQIEKKDKKSILNYLEHKFNICGDTIYNDMQGFIVNQARTSTKVMMNWTRKKAQQEDRGKIVHSKKS